MMLLTISTNLRQTWIPAYLTADGVMFVGLKCEHLLDTIFV